MLHENGRADYGKGNYWSIHLSSIEDFAKGDFRRRQARRRVRNSFVKTVNGSFNVNNTRQQLGYVPMTSSQIRFNSYSAKVFPMHTDFENRYQNVQSPLSTFGITRTSFPAAMQTFGSYSLFPFAPSASVGRPFNEPSTYCMKSSFGPSTYSTLFSSCHMQKRIPDWWTKSIPYYLM